eukprot:PhM_4_TR823/c0_g1_i1/m.4805
MLRMRRATRRHSLDSWRSSLRSSPTTSSSVSKKCISALRPTASPLGSRWTASTSTRRTAPDRRCLSPQRPTRSTFTRRRNCHSSVCTPTPSGTSSTLPRILQSLLKWRRTVLDRARRLWSPLTPHRGCSSRGHPRVWTWPCPTRSLPWTSLPLPCASTSTSTSTSCPWGPSGLDGTALRGIVVSDLHMGCGPSVVRPHGSGGALLSALFVLLCVSTVRFRRMARSPNQRYTICFRIPIITFTTSWCVLARRTIVDLCSSSARCPSMSSSASVTMCTRSSPTTSSNRLPKSSPSSPSRRSVRGARTCGGRRRPPRSSPRLKRSPRRGAWTPMRKTSRPLSSQKPSSGRVFA